MLTGNPRSVNGVFVILPGTCDMREPDARVKPCSCLVISACCSVSFEDIFDV